MPKKTPAVSVHSTPLPTSMRRALAITASVFLFVSGQAAADPHDRLGWVGGFGYGVGSAQFTGAGGYRHKGKTGVTTQFHFGRMLVKQRLLVSVGVNQWVAENGGLPEVPADPGTDFVKFQVNSQLYSLGLTAYPGNPRSVLGGFFLSAGGGPAVGRVDVAQAPLTGTGGEDPPEVVNYDWGWGFSVGAGYEWRVFRSVAAGATVQYYHTSNNGKLIDSSKVLPVSLSLNWYF